MSRIGLQPISIPKGVTVTVQENSVLVKGAKGELSQTFLPLVEIVVEANEVLVSRKNDSKKAKSVHGLYRSLVNNMVQGVSQGFVKRLVINGVGYRAEMMDKTLLLNLGYSNQVEYMVPDGIQILVEGNTKIAVNGIEKGKVGQVAAEIRKIRPPEPYKGKGIRYEDENVRRKAGKSGAK